MESNETSIDINHLKSLIRIASTVSKGEPQCIACIDLFSYILKFRHYHHMNPELTHNVRLKCKEIELYINDSVANGDLNFDTATKLTQLMTEYLEQTSFLSEFDFEETETISYVTGPEILEEYSDSEQSDFSDKESKN